MLSSLILGYENCSSSSTQSSSSVSPPHAAAHHSPNLRTTPTAKSQLTSSRIKHTTYYHLSLLKNTVLVLHLSFLKNIHTSPLMMEYSITVPQKLVVVMGATGSGKSRLSLDLAARFPPATFEVINTDKMQLYKGLDITTNKLSAAERRVVPHHLLGVLDSDHGDVSPAEFRRLATQVLSSVLFRGKVPVLVGGSNSFIHALLVDRFEPGVDVFDGEAAASSELRYDCCFLWVDVAFPVLKAYLSQRVKELLDSGMVHELAEFHCQNPAVRTGLSKAIGVAEFGRFFEVEEDNPVRRGGAYEEAVQDYTRNTWQLAKRQIGKIAKLKEMGWDLKRVEATEAFRAAVKEENGGKGWKEIWESKVVEPSVKIVKQYLLQEE